MVPPAGSFEQAVGVEQSASVAFVVGVGSAAVDIGNLAGDWVEGSLGSWVGTEWVLPHRAATEDNLAAGTAVLPGH